MSSLIAVTCLLATYLNGFAVSQEVYHVLPDESMDCPSNDASRCHTFTYYIESFNEYFVSNTTFNFLAGNHNLASVLRLTDLESLTFSGVQQGNSSTVQCNGNETVGAGLIIMNVSSLQITNMMFVGCHVELEQEQMMMNTYAKTFLEFSLPVTFGIYLNYIIDVKMMNVEVSRSGGYGVLGVNLLGNVTINNVHFAENNYETLSKLSCFENVNLGCKGGNLALVYTDLLDCPARDPPRYSITISNSFFVKGANSGITYVPFNTAINRNDLQFIGGAGIGLHMMQSSYGIDVLIENCFIENNAAFVGANLYMLMWDFVDNSTITVKNSTLNYGVNAIGSTQEILTGSNNVAMGFFYYYGLRPFGSYIPVCQAKRKYEVEVFTMEDCDVSYNNATLASAALVQENPQSFLNYPREVQLKRIKFQSNNGDATIVIFGQGSATKTFKTLFSECQFIGNLYQVLNSSFVGSTNHQVVYQISVMNVEYVSCLWSHNRGTSLHAIQSTIIFTGENKFINNSAIDGAGLKIQEGSEVFLQPSSKTMFIGNRAENFGGAIYAVMLSYRCFFQLNYDENLPVLYFSNNNAESAGEAVYGIIRVCILDGFSYADDSFETFLQISQFTEEFNSSSSIVSSKANRLCLCAEDAPPCSISSASYYDISTYPGKTFNVTVQAFGFFGNQNVSGHTPADISAAIISNSSYAIITSGENQHISKECSNASYMLQGNANQTVDISLFPITEVLFYPSYIRVTLNECPFGFSLHEQSACKCDSFFVNRDVTCDIETGLFMKVDTQWIGIVNHQLAVGTCTEPEYCKRTSEPLSLFAFNHHELDVQCVDHHSGVLCGECQPGYSITLGSSKCLKCSNGYLALLIFFAIAGLMWIAFLSFFDATVKTGRVNGMLFYANVIKLANFEFFRLRQSGFYIFQIMIDWINLDFGIESCFYDGFDYYAKSWLNFAFPLYLFVHIGIIALCARKFDKFYNFLPKNMLSVMTTLVLICFTKLLRSSTNALPYQVLEMQNETRRVWQYDGNMSYFDWKHGILLSFSVLVLLVFVIPFALVMITYPYLQSFTGHENTFFEKIVCFFRKKIFKLKPLLETYDGPYLIKHRYYTGLLVVLRMMIYLITASVYTNSVQAWFKPTTVSIICIVLLGLVAKGKIYGCSVNTMVELLFLVNVTVLEFILMVMQLSSVKQETQGIAVSCSVSVAFLTFVGVLIYEKYIVLEPKIYASLGKDHVSRVEHCVALRKQEEAKAVKIGVNDETDKILDFIDEAEVRRMQLTKQEQLIQQLIVSPDTI